MKPKLYYVVVLLFFLLLIHTQSHSQGCVAVRNMSGCSILFDSTQGLSPWQFSMNYRYFRSYKHFVGRDEQEHRVREGTEVINNDNSVIIGINYTINNRWSISTLIPLLYIDRSSLYEHLGNSSGQRFHTQSKGLGDVRVIGYYNSMPSYHKGSLIFGLGLKAPTGNYRAKDSFHRPEGVVKRVVDQSMQPGDGGVGIITEVQLTHRLSGNFFGYVNGLYMMNTRNTNGVERSPNPIDRIPRSNEFSVADQYLIRAGVGYHAHLIQVSLGGRMECIPSKDLIGESDGFRRPGYIISVEPSAFYTRGPHTIGLNFPVALVRNRTRSQIDIARGGRMVTVTNPDGSQEQKFQIYHGDAAFADWLVSVSYAYRLPGK